MGGMGQSFFKSFLFLFHNGIKLLNLRDLPKKGIFYYLKKCIYFDFKVLFL